jgi:hypothetical protein
VGGGKPSSVARLVLVGAICLHIPTPCRWLLQTAWRHPPCPCRALHKGASMQVKLYVTRSPPASAHSLCATFAIPLEHPIVPLAALLAIVNRISAPHARTVSTMHALIIFTHCLQSETSEVTLTTKGTATALCSRASANRAAIVSSVALR